MKKKVSIKQHINNVKHKFKAAELKVHNAIKKHPEKAALIAASVGAAISAAVTAAILLRKKK